MGRFFLLISFVMLSAKCIHEYCPKSKGAKPYTVKEWECSTTHVPGGQCTLSPVSVVPLAFFYEHKKCTLFFFGLLYTNGSLVYTAHFTPCCFHFASFLDSYSLFSQNTPPCPALGLLCRVHHVVFKKFPVDGHLGWFQPLDMIFLKV